MDYVDSTLTVAERYRPPSIIVRTLVHDGLSMLDGYVCMELRSLLYEALGGE